jgi:hypothetical protein
MVWIWISGGILGYKKEGVLGKLFGFLMTRIGFI